MPLSELTGQARVSPFSEEDRIHHMQLMVQRTFGVEASELGTIEIDYDRGALVIQHDGKERRLRWRRGQRGAIHWHLDDNERPLRLSGGNNPLARLREALDA